MNRADFDQEMNTSIATPVDLTNQPRAEVDTKSVSQSKKDPPSIWKRKRTYLLIPVLLIGVWFLLFMAKIVVDTQLAKIFQNNSSPTPATTPASLTEAHDQQSLDDLSSFQPPSDNTPTSQPIPIESISTEGWQTYQSDLFGISFLYPPNFSTDFKVTDTRSMLEEYYRKCDDGEYDGCGGSDLSEYKIEFIEKNAASLPNPQMLDIDIIQYPNADTGEFSASNQFITVSTARYSMFDETIQKQLVSPGDAVLKAVIESVNFIPSNKPQSCLWRWSPRVGPGLVTAYHADLITGMGDQATPVSGYFFDKSTNDCQKSEYFVSRRDLNESPERHLPPFSTYQECTNTCR